MAFFMCSPTVNICVHQGLLGLSQPSTQTILINYLTVTSSLYPKTTLTSKNTKKKKFLIFR